MAKRLTAAGVRAAKPGVHGDAHGLRLRVLPSRTRQWIWRGTVRGRRRDLELGGWPVVTLAEARDAALECKRAARQGEDPATLSVPTFAEACERTIALHKPTWKGSARTEVQWRATLRDYAMPRLGGMRVGDVTAADVLAVLTPIWATKPATADRVRVRIGAVMKWCVAEGHRADDPAEAVRSALPRSNGPTRHHRATGHASMADVLRAVREAAGAWKGTKIALTFAALTATRPAEVCGMTWGEAEGEAWQIPAARMKTAKPHRVPLSRQALAVLDQARALTGGGADERVFPSQTGKALSTAVLLRLLTDLGTGTTTHGFRSAFRSWAAESGVDREVAEAALAHLVRGTEGAYQRSDLFERRREVMQRWADYILPT